MSGCNLIVPINGVYLTEHDFPEWQNRIEEIYNVLSDGKDRDARFVRVITFVVTQRCNLNCTYCYENHDLHKKGRKLTKETAKAAVDMLFDEEKMKGYMNLTQSKGVILDFIGGEPLLEIDLIDYTMDYFYHRAFEEDHPWLNNSFASISTNGVLYMNPKVQKFLKKHKGNISIGISLDGTKEQHDSCRVFPDGTGSYDFIIEGVHEWLKNESKPQTKLTIAPENMANLNESIRHLWDLGIININANCVYENVWKPEHSILFYNELKKLADYMLDSKLYYLRRTSLFLESIGRKNEETQNYCGGTGDMLAIDPSGNCFPCLRYMQHSLKPEREEVVIGDVIHGIESMEDSKWRCHMSCITMDSQSDDKCRSCEISTGCGLCSAYNYDEFGDMGIRATYICGTHQARVLANAYYWNSLYKALNLKGKVFKLNIPKDWALSIISEEEYNNLLVLEDWENA
jgi:uncharacterized protein